MGSGTSARERLAGLALSLHADLAAVELFAALESAGLEALLLRGAAIAARLYDDGGRAYGDCDVLVAEPSRPAVEAVLHQLGYVSYTALSSAQHWRRENDHTEIDLHRSLHGARAPHDVFWSAMAAHRSEVEVRGATIPALDEPGTALVIVLHAAQHGGLVAHPLEDMRRALARWDLAVWSDAARLAAEVGALVAFRQGLAMIPEGLQRLDEIGLAPEVTARSAMRRRGIELPDYFEESLSVRERTTILARRVWPSRAEIALTFDPRAAESTTHLLSVHVRRLARLPVRTVELTTHWRHARREAKAFGKGQAGR